MNLVERLAEFGVPTEKREEVAGLIIAAVDGGSGTASTTVNLPGGESVVLAVEFVDGVPVGVEYGSSSSVDASVSRAAKASHRSDERLTPAEFRCFRESLGLTVASLAELLGVRKTTVDHWAYGIDPIPYGVSAEMLLLRAEWDEELARMVDAGPVDWLVTFKKDADYWAALPYAAPRSAGWHRAVTAAAARQLGARIRYA